MAARIDDTGGLANMPPKIAPESILSPMKPAWLGSWPLPPPERRDTRDWLGWWGDDAKEDERTTWWLDSLRRWLGCWRRRPEMNSSTALEGSLRNFFGVVMVALLLIYLPGLKRFGFWIRFEKRCGHVSYLCLLNKNIYFNLMK